MWDEATKPLVESGKLQVLGVVQEQHATRARLYAQWQRFAWPIAQDPLTKLNLSVVPIAVLLDEHGVVRAINPRPNELKELVTEGFPEPEEPMPTGSEGAAKSHPDVEEADQLILFASADQSQLSDAIEKYQFANAESAAHPELRFRLGVAFRMRFDSEARQPNDFSRAVAHWTSALEQNPGQYIWRRRLQQYGPRQIKPYPFYDWVPQAIEEITSRGEQPVALDVALTESELAKPIPKNHTDEVLERPRLDAVPTDSAFVQVRSTIVPARVRAGEPVRVYLRFEIQDAKWNNEGDVMKVWVQDATGPLSRCYLAGTSASAATSSEPRSFEFDFPTPADVRQCTITGVATYGICENETGQCSLRRKEFTVDVPLATD